MRLEYLATESGTPVTPSNGPLFGRFAIKVSGVDLSTLPDSHVGRIWMPYCNHATQIKRYSSIFRRMMRRDGSGKSGFRTERFRTESSACLDLVLWAKSGRACRHFPRLSLRVSLTCCDFDFLAESLLEAYWKLIGGPEIAQRTSKFTTPENFPRKPVMVERGQSSISTRKRSFSWAFVGRKNLRTERI